MEDLLKALSREIVFWMAWIIIPLVVELIPALMGFFILIKKSLRKKLVIPPGRYPDVTLIIPIYNSAETLRGCIASIAASTYPTNRIDAMLVDNGSKDASFEVFCACQKEFPLLDLRWMTAAQGKAKALNMALFSSKGKYVINIDSDGQLHPQALENMVLRFEQNAEIHCMTAVILTDPQLIEKTPSLFMRTIRRCEFYEYCQAFLAGRNYQSEQGNIYTLSGACSAFRKSAIMKTQLYNTQTVSEDTHVTFQIRNLLKKNVYLCEDAFFIVDPVESCEKLYTQRQRWQRGEIEVTHMFYDDELTSPKKVLKNSSLRLLLFDHTFAFPRMIWYFALIFLVFLNYPLSLVVGSMVIIYSLYIVSGFLFYLNICFYLKPFPDVLRYYRKKWWLLILMPLFNLYTFFIRFAGIINSIKSDSRWKTDTFTEEKKRFSAVLKHDLHIFSGAVEKLKGRINNE